MELCIVVVLVEDGTATTVVLVEFKRFKIGMVLGDLECITLLTMLGNKNAVPGSSKV